MTVFCECGGLLINEFRGAFSCNTCDHYEIDGNIITTSEGLLTKEYVIEEYVLYKGTPYKKVRTEANVNDLIMLEKPVDNKQIYRVVDYGGYSTKSIKISREIEVKNYDQYHVLKPFSSGGDSCE